MQPELGERDAETGVRAGDPSVRALVERLREASPVFRAAWERYDIRGFASRERRFRHPSTGELTLEHHQLTPTDHPDLRVVVYTALG